MQSQCGTTEVVFWAISGILLAVLVVVGVLQLTKKTGGGGGGDGPLGGGASLEASAKRVHFNDPVGVKTGARDDAGAEGTSVEAAFAAHHPPKDSSPSLDSFFTDTAHPEFDAQFKKHDKAHLQDKLGSSPMKTAVQFSEMGRSSNRSRATGVDVLGGLRPPTKAMTLSGDVNFMNLSDARWHALQT